MRCMVRGPIQASRENLVAKRWVTVLAVISSVFTAVLLFGFLRTWLRSDIGHRNKSDASTPFPRR
jgi:hypothetical protein